MVPEMSLNVSNSEIFLKMFRFEDIRVQKNAIQ